MSWESLGNNLKNEVIATFMISRISRSSNYNCNLENRIFRFQVVFPILLKNKNNKFARDNNYFKVHRTHFPAFNFYTQLSYIKFSQIRTTVMHQYSKSDLWNEMIIEYTYWRRKYFRIRPVDVQTSGLFSFWFQKPPN